MKTPVTKNGMPNKAAIQPLLSRSSSLYGAVRRNGAGGAGRNSFTSVDRISQIGRIA